MGSDRPARRDTVGACNRRAARHAPRHGGAGLARPRRCGLAAGGAGRLSAGAGGSAQAPGFARPEEWHPDHGLPGSMLCPRFRDGYARLADHGLHFELQTTYWHLPDAADLARAFPHIRMVINHTGVPGDRRPDTLTRWRAAMTAVAACPNVMVKISGLGVPGEAWTVAANEGVVRDTLALFGVERCMFASNYPVDGLFRSLDGIFADFKAMTRDMAPADRRRLFNDNARAVYRLHQPEEVHAQS
ncbi:amidohydrolase family protein [Ancylobacter dichloromethanicus]